jgi:hypothetical protein
MTWIWRSPSLTRCAFSSAGPYQRLLNPRIEESVAIRSRIRSPCSQTADRYTFSVRFPKAKIAETTLEECELRVGGGRDDRVNIKGWPCRSGSRIGEQESCNAASDEGDLVEQRRELRRSRNELSEIRIVGANVHTEFALLWPAESILAVSSRIAISRSRARPSRMASRRARSS